MTQWSEVETWERQTGHTHPDHDAALRNDERMKITKSFAFAIAATVIAFVMYGGLHG